MGISRTFRYVAFLAVALLAGAPARADVAVAMAEAWKARPAVLPPGVSLLDRIVAFVDDEIVTLFEVDKAAQTNVSLGLGFAGQGAAKEVVDKEALDALVDEILVLGEAHKLGLTVADAEIDSYLERVKSNSKWSDEELARNVARLGFTMGAYRERTRKELLKSKVIGVKVGSRVNVGEADVQRVLDAEYGGGAFEEEARVSLILKRVAPDADAATVKEAERFARWLQQQAEAAPERFADLARKFSEHDASRPYGGDIGYFKRGTLADESLERVAFDSPVGTVSDVIRTPFGFQVVMVTDRRRAPVDDIEQLKDTIYERLVVEARIAAYKEWLETLRERSYVEYRL